MTKRADRRAEQQASAALRLLVFLLFFFSGATALVYQIAWVRSLTLTFGASHEAVGIVLAAFMGGLALGGITFGRLSERVARPLRLYGLLEIGIGLVALVLPLLLRLGDGIYVAAALRVEGVPWSLSLLRIAMALSVLVLPTFLMGGTLPILARLLVSGSREFGLRLSQLYAINTLGAVTGALAAGFLLLPALGVRSTEFTAVGLNLAIGAVALLIAGKFGTGDLPSQPAPEAAPSERGAAPEMDRYGVWALRLTFVGTAVSGACALALEVMWTRGISIAVGRTTYSFTVMLAAFLIGIALGSWLHALIPLRRVGVSLQFGIVLSGIGISSIVFSQLIPDMPRLAVWANAWLAPSAGGLRVATTLITSFAIMLVPCVLMGVAFPLAGQARVRLRERFGQAVGEVVGLNTLGAIIGSLAAAYLLIPRFGLQRGMLLVSALNLSYGLIVIGFATAGSKVRIRPIVLPLTGLLAAGALALPVLLPDWDIHLLATFRNNTLLQQLEPADPEERDGAANAMNVLYYREGRSSNVSVIDNGRDRAMLIDGKSVASDSLTDMEHELLLGHLPVLLHPAPRSAAVVGLGAGITLGGVLAHPEIERVVLVEIEPAVVEGARQFADVNGDALDDPRLEIAFQDGRNYLRTSSHKFDVITADPIHPWAHGASYLYTTDYYAMVAERLAPGGLMCQWLPLYELSGENVRSVVASFADNFRYTSLWQTAYDAVLIGGDSPLEVDALQLRERLRVDRALSQLSEIGLGDPLSFLSELTLDSAGIDAFSQGARRNTDDNLYLEFSSPLSIGTPEVFENIRGLNARRVTMQSVMPDPAPLLPAGAVPAQILDEYRQAKSRTVEAHIALQSAKVSQSPTPYPPVIETLNGILSRVPDYGRARSLLCLAWTQYGLRLREAGQHQEGLTSLARAVDVMPTNAEANYRLAVALSELGRPDRALSYFESAGRSRPRYARSHNDHAVTLMRLGRFEEARELLTVALELRPQFLDAEHNLALALLRTGRLEEAESRFESVRRVDPDLPGLNNNYAVLLVERSRYRDAVGVLEDGLRQDASDIRMIRQLAWLLATAPDPELRDGIRAVELARELNMATGQRVPEVMDTLAAALAETGRFQEAIDVAVPAAEFAAAQGQTELAEQIGDRIQTYQEGRPFRI
jgi:spermidine synthase